jgi:hypothetical protein
MAYGGGRLAQIEELARRRFYLVEAEADHVHLDHFEVLDQGKRESLAAYQGVEEGAKLSLKLLEVDRYDPAAAVGKVGEVDVVVAEGAPLVGKKAKVVVGRVLAGAAYATRADLEDGVGPISFEGEAEKPTRAPAAKKKQEPAKPKKQAGKVAEVTEELAVEEVENEAEVVETEVSSEAAAEEVGEGAAKPRKKTRRGSRGGRRRRKEPATADAAGETDGEAVDVVDAGPRAEPEPESTEPAKPAPRRKPKIHVPEHLVDGVSGNGRGSVDDGDAEPAAEAAEESDEQPKPRKKTRRGSRGGRGRKKKVAATGVADPEAGTEAVATAEVVEDYVPMSEWIDDIVP